MNVLTVHLYHTASRAAAGTRRSHSFIRPPRATSLQELQRRLVVRLDVIRCSASGNARADRGISKRSRGIANILSVSEKA
jgi:hypothetical protein